MTMDQDRIDEMAVAMKETPHVIYNAAKEYFDRNGFGRDFALQAVTSRVIVFGSTNRLLWDYRNGFRPDRSYCTPKFQAAWDKARI